MLNKNKNLIIVIVVIAVITLGTYFWYSSKENDEGSVQGLISPKQAASKAISFINENMLPEGVTASFISVVDENGIYKFKMKVEDQEYDSYVTKDGKLFFIEGIDLDMEIEKPETPDDGEEFAKEEKPDVKLFVMSYCPYGLQAQKMFLPVYELLKDEADMGIYFVNYIMHGEEEIEENINQYCIQKEQADKFSDYLNCFVKEGDSQKCLSEASVNETILSECFSATDNEFSIYSQYQDQGTWLNGQFPKFGVHDALNQQYGVRGSPTVVINGTSVTVSPRSPEKFKQVVCQAFNSPPEECSQTLSDTAFSPGFGMEGGNTSAGGCGG